MDCMQNKAQNTVSNEIINTNITENEIANENTMSTLYSLTDDISSACDDYCKLQNQLISVS